MDLDQGFSVMSIMPWKYHTNIDVVMGKNVEYAMWVTLSRLVNNANDRMAF